MQVSSSHERELNQANIPLTSTAFSAVSPHLTHHCGLISGSTMSLDRLNSKKTPTCMNTSLSLSFLHTFSRHTYRSEPPSNVPLFLCIGPSPLVLPEQLSWHGTSSFPASALTGLTHIGNRAHTLRPFPHLEPRAHIRDHTVVIHHFHKGQIVPHSTIVVIVVVCRSDFHGPRTKSHVDHIISNDWQLALTKWMEAEFPNQVLQGTRDEKGHKGFCHRKKGAWQDARRVKQDNPHCTASPED